jgi:hypothetical protein
MKQVFVAQHPAEAYLVRGVLEAEGIPAEVQGESLYGMRGEAPLTPDTLPSVWVVDDNDASKAIAILVAYARQDPAAAARASWHCPKCGESVEPQFTECWHCGASRPGN